MFLVLAAPLRACQCFASSARVTPRLAGLRLPGAENPPGNLNTSTAERPPNNRAITYQPQPSAISRPARRGEVAVTVHVRHCATSRSIQLGAGKMRESRPGRSRTGAVPVLGRR
ncbi:hypothetical protein DACRYDRAFT_106077 [Dacryopinax primogenitus]|uniref:Uncharacterized protein n=1 Tax=Dacryopinax primogenitus (strain DJM 731) TaxID=1858805 RepID=M5G6T0_DACPD|nr:uncharacterized protein DACRYDRAFT_106077 [Dacryopinax primogenitus]EJU03915.1 hypothetical protein DACRYDRAFT_106077 [Dacryopinax primogenitus]